MLQHKGVSCSSLCVVCESEIEDLWDLMFTCKQSVDCWILQDLWQYILPQLDSAQSAKELIFSLLSSLSADKKAIFATTMWNLWRGRNDLLWENVNMIPSQLTHRAVTFLGDWVCANSLEA